MGILSKLLGSSAVEGAKTLGEVADNLFTSDDERLSHAEVMERIKNEPKLAQIVNNQIEASHPSIFVAGWRPAIGWVCAAGLANHFLVNVWLVWWTGKAGPEIDIASMIGLVTALLGLGYLRTDEKKAGVHTKH